MTTTKPLVTADDLLHMGKDAPFELIDGVLKEFSWKGAVAGIIGAKLGAYIGQFVDASQLGYVTGGKGGYILSRNPDTVVAPSIGFVRGDRFPAGIPAYGFSPIPPDLAVEVMSFADTFEGIAEKQTLYTRAGVPLVWWVDPEQRTVTIHQPGQEPEVLGESQTLDGGDILPGFSLPVERIFAIRPRVGQ